MAYVTGTSTDVEDLLDQLRIAIAANGWTINRFTQVSGITELFTQSVNGGFHALQANSTQDNPETITPKPWVKISSYVDYQPSYTINDGSQAAIPTNSYRNGSYTNGLFGPFLSHHFFISDSYVYVTIEIETGLYAHFGFGIINKFFNFTGGDFNFGTNWNHQLTARNRALEEGLHSAIFSSNNSAANTSQSGTVRFDRDTYVEEWATSYNSAASSAYTEACSCLGINNYQQSSRKNIFGNLFFCTPSVITGISDLIPSTLFVNSRAENTYIIGDLTNLRFINMTNIVPGQEITLGSDVWKCFPIKRKTNYMGTGGQSQNFNSYFFGVAYKK